MRLSHLLISLSMIAASGAAMAHGNLDNLLGGAVGGAAGAVIGSSMGGRDGAVVGGAIGAATGVILSNQGGGYRERHYRPVERERVVYVREEREHFRPRWHHDHGFHNGFRDKEYRDYGYGRR